VVSINCSVPAAVRQPAMPSTLQIPGIVWGDKAKPLAAPQLAGGFAVSSIRPGRREASRPVTAFSFRVWWYWQLDDICVTAPNRRLAVITKIVAQIEYAHSGEVKDDSAEESKADYSSRSYQGWPEWSVGWWRKRLHFRLSNVGQVAMPLAGRSALPHRSRPSR
jgi:hypothetical protein